MRIQLSCVLAALAVTAAATPALAQWTVYDNSSNPLGEFKDMGGLEFGDRVQRVSTPELYQLATFEFEYFAQTLATGGGQQAVLRMYANDGPVTAYSGGQNTPGTLLFDSSAIGQYVSLSSGWNTAVLNAGSTGISIPDTFTWTVQFTGLQAGDVVGLPIYGPVDIGSSGSDFWAKDAGEWGSYTLASGTPANFAARVIMVPEPSAVQLALLAGAGWLGWLVFRRRS
jgi:hypothetical protein